MGKNLMTPELVSERERKISDFIVKQKQTYDFKIRYAEIRVR